MANANDLSGYIRNPNNDNVLVKYAVIDAHLTGDTTLVAAVAGKKIRVISMFYLAAATVSVRFESGTGGTSLTGNLQHTAQTGVVLNYNEDGWFETAAGALLNLELTGGGVIAVDGALSYIEV